MKINKITIVLFLATALFSSCSRTKEALPQRKDIVDAVFASGSITMEKNYLITAQTEGVLSESYVTEGDSVQIGQLLFKIQNEPQQAMVVSAEAGYRYAEDNTKSASPVWQKLKQQHIQLSNQLANDSIQYMRYKNLYATHAVSKAEYDRAELTCKNTQSQMKELENTMADTRKSLELEALNAKAGYLTQQNNNDQYLLKTEYSGLVLNAPKIAGELVKRGETLAQIGAGKYLAKLLISESDINKVKIGQEVFIELNTDKKESHKAVITKIYPAFDNTEQSFVAEAEFTGNAGILRVGTQLQANIVVGESKNALVIPVNYLLSDDQVLLAKTGKKVTVQTGIVTPEWIEVKTGLNDSDKIKIAGNGR
ncbi:MAG: HlyD family efflux transporter periplasmic adaptor subunit [Paludibacter sp.]|nr:HlyD family efflux transporter periplasmic adaptor subunit [Paludibacter sp.]